MWLQRKFRTFLDSRKYQFHTLSDMYRKAFAAVMQFTKQKKKVKEEHYD